MEKVIIKKKEYNPIEELGEHTLLAENDGKKYIIKYLGVKTLAFSDFKYATKRIKAANVSSPKVVIIDKKTGCAVLEYIDGRTMYEELIDHDFDDNIYEQLFEMNWVARRSMLQLNFNPHNFRYSDGKIYYMPFTFDIYKRSNDFTENDLRLWFYTKEFEKLLINDGINLQKSRLLPDFELNKKIVLTVVKYYK